MATSSSSVDAKRTQRTQQVMIGMKIGTEIVPVGLLLVDRAMSGDRDVSTGRFRYSAKYLRRPDAVPIDPVQMPLTDGELRFAKFGGLPSAIRDAAPDNWGRLLIRRYYYARGFDGPLGEVDYLLSSPMDRAGNLHFAVNFGKDGAPVWDEKALRTEDLPEMVELKEHVVAVLKDQKGQFNKPYPKSVDALLTGSGGARPKVNVTAKDGTYLAKLAYPEKDRTSNARLEEASLRMAALVGINAVRGTAKTEADSDFLTVKRFDRQGEQSLQMVSAMTVLNASDDAFNFANWSYPLLAVELDRWSSDAAADKEQLFRCMVLHAMLSDGDDHPRNYSLIRDPSPVRGKPQAGGSTLGQWRLAPLYDIVAGRGEGRCEHELAMSIGAQGTMISEQNILSQCKAFGLTRERAASILSEIEAKVLRLFPEVLKHCNVSSIDTELTMRGIIPIKDRKAHSPIQALMAQADARAAARQAAEGPAVPPTSRARPR